jgi:hypothetical protein
MKHYLVLLVFVALVTANKGMAQDKKGVKKEGAHQAEYNANAEKREHSPEIDSRNLNRSDSTGPDVGEQSNFDDHKNSNLNTSSPAGTKTTSSSGSPGVLMGDHNTPDGTNTIQSATPNIAGSPIPGSKKGKENKSGVVDNKNFSSKKAGVIPKSEKQSAKNQKASAAN